MQNGLIFQALIIRTGRLERARATMTSGETFAASIFCVDSANPIESSVKLRLPAVSLLGPLRDCQNVLKEWGFSLGAGSMLLVLIFTDLADWAYCELRYWRPL